MMKSRRLDTIASTCLARQSRVLSRALNGIYQEALRPHGLLPTQFTVLVAIASGSKATPDDLVRGLHLEKSTVSRNVGRLRRQGWITVEDDRPGIVYRITPEGDELLEAAYSDWKRAQRRASALLGGEGLRALEFLSSRVMNAD